MYFRDALGKHRLFDRCEFVSGQEDLAQLREMDEGVGRQASDVVVRQVKCRQILSQI